MPRMLPSSLVAASLLSLASSLVWAQGSVASSSFPGADTALEEVDFRSHRGFSLAEDGGWMQLDMDVDGVRPGKDSGSAVLLSEAISVPLTDPRPFIAVAPVIHGHRPAHAGVVVELRASLDGERWGEWQEASDHGHGPDTGPGLAQRLKVDLGDQVMPGELAFFDPETRYLQYRVSLSADFLGNRPRLARLSLHFISPGETTESLASKPLADEGRLLPQSAQPGYVPRSSWGNLSNTAWHPLANVSQLVVHHTVSANSSNDWAAVVRSFYNYHVNSLGWSDIGYNWLVAPDGTLFQGRAHRPDGNTDVVGAHVAGHNSYTMGLAYIGTYTSVNPSAAAVETGAQLLAWKAAQHGISTSLIRGHRDYGATACPGDSLYARLFDTLRPRVQQILDGDSGEPEPDYDVLWHRAAAKNANPWYFGDNRQRGLAVAGDRLYVVSRHSETWGPHVMIHQSADGAGVDGGGASLLTDGIAGGTLVLNDIDADDDGGLFAANLTVDMSGDAFRVYYWPDDSAVPLTVVNFSGTAPHRVGDRITVTGSMAAGTATIWAPASNAPVIYRWHQNGDGFNQWPQAIHLSDGASGAAAGVAPLANGRFLWNAAGEHLRLYEGDGSLLGTVPGAVVARDSSGVRVLGRDGNDLWAAVYQFGTSNENARIVRIPQTDPSTAGTLGVSPSLAHHDNPNATGDISIRRNGNGSIDVFVLATNNGLGAYRVEDVAAEPAGLQAAPRHQGESVGPVRTRPVSVLPESSGGDTPVTDELVEGGEGQLR
ncbi:N-acetylmuramoyl-L-alanine amidase [Gammaproteobacteria bacterium AB-CW1]|uniref:N-acetylmuramoyl-L-alanine amidase n=1 Tax=Natronospira elongata TaxID=3110268 RepID=A0AAP6JFJ7_9GAMM|nr:N-acetylmuramoyl-L-alanine amidase [Gammaproteobacteria bacterium AB-CW1]